MRSCQVLTLEDRLAHETRQRLYFSSLAAKQGIEVTELNSLLDAPSYSSPLPNRPTHGRTPGHHDPRSTAAAAAGEARRHPKALDHRPQRSTSPAKISSFHRQCLSPDRLKARESPPAGTGKQQQQPQQSVTGLRSFRSPQRK